MVICCYGMRFSKCDIFFSLAFPIPGRLNEMGSHTSVELDFPMDSKLSEEDIGNEKRMD